MDYRALGELIWFSFLGLSALTLVTGFSVRIFLAPVVREVLGRFRTASDREQQMLSLKMEQVEDRLAEVESQLHRIAAAEDFRRQLEAPGGAAARGSGKDEEERG